ncbi:hypothetical protein [Oceanispirochaeta sp.]|jgi:hypothetical protein|uniref:hypothetical protein n=1 Tax=Oceanispirochaeta sp. TaxID=2035350 RepID=UPI00263831EF|nr:hypothetical protein [Oceanispirochaeta sp.]MDA3956988.1 hypothetical protein [Oceanispirochaeta sp.]
MKIYEWTLFVFVSFFTFISCSTHSLVRVRSLEKFLKSHDLEYTVDSEGDFRILSAGEKQPRDVWIRGDINYSGSIGIREIFTFSSLLGPLELSRVSRVLLLDNLQTRVMGSWSLLKDHERDQYLILYTVKAPLNAKEDYILQAIKESSEAAMILERVLSPGL